MSAAMRAKMLGENSEISGLESLRVGLEDILFNFRNQSHVLATKYNQYLTKLEKVRPKLGMTPRGSEYLYKLDVFLETLGSRVARAIEIDTVLKEVSAAYTHLKRAEIAWNRSATDSADKHWRKTQELSGFLQGDLTDHPEIVEYASRFRAFSDVMSGRSDELTEHASSLLEMYAEPGKDLRGVPRPNTTPIRFKSGGPGFNSDAFGTPAVGPHTTGPAGSRASKSAAGRASGGGGGGGGGGGFRARGRAKDTKGKGGFRAAAGKKGASGGGNAEGGRARAGSESYSYGYSDDEAAGAKTGPAARAQGHGFDSDSAASYSYSYYSSDGGGTTARTRRQKSARGARK